MPGSDNIFETAMGATIATTAPLASASHVAFGDIKQTNTPLKNPFLLWLHAESKIIRRAILAQAMSGTAANGSRT